MIFIGLALFAGPLLAAVGDDPLVCDGVWEWGNSTPTTANFFVTPKLAMDEHAASFCTSSPQYSGCTAVPVGFNAGTIQYTYEIFATLISTGVYAKRVSLTATTKRAKTYGACPPTFDCATLANVKTLGTANDQPDTFTPADSICVKNGNVGGVVTPMSCAAFKNAKQTWKRLGPSGARDWLAAYQFTGLACDAEPEQPQTQPTDTDSDTEKCKTGAGGLTFCSSPDNETDCGFFNDKYVCLKSLGTDKCMTKADGSRICAAGAATPPVPDNGTPGVKATPSDTMTTQDGQNGTSNTYNFYNTTTNNSSSRPTGSGGNTDGSGAVGPGGESATSSEGGVDPTADDSAGGGTTCDAEPTCDGDPIQCVLLNQQWRTRCPDVQTSEAVQAAMGATAGELDGSALFSAPQDLSTAWSEDGGIAVGACPAPLNISVMGQSIGLDVWSAGCDMATLFAPIVMAMAYFAAVLLFLRSNW